MTEFRDCENARWRWTVYLALKQWAEQQEQADQRFHPEVWLTPEDVEEITEKIGWPRFPTPPAPATPRTPGGI